jgi:hypothetical protein
MLRAPVSPVGDPLSGFAVQVSLETQIDHDEPVECDAEFAGYLSRAESCAKHSSSTLLAVLTASLLSGHPEENSFNELCSGTGFH